MFWEPRKVRVEKPVLSPFGVRALVLGKCPNFDRKDTVLVAGLLLRQVMLVGL